MASQDRGTQTDGYELLINGMSSPPEFITKDGFNYKFNSYNARQEKSRDNGFNYDFRHQCYKTFWCCNKLAYVNFY